MLDYRVETFLELCRVMNYRVVANHLHMTQPAVTQHIHNLEAYYGCKLFLYDHHSLHMTPEAQKLKQHLESVRYQEQKLRQSFQSSETVSLRIGATRTIGEYVLGPHVAAFLREKRNAIQVEVHNTEVLLELLRSGRLDFALIEGAFDQTEFAWQRYQKVPFVGICSSRHKFAGRTVSREELLGETLIVREEGSGTRQIMESLLQNENLSLELFPSVTGSNNFGLMVSLLKENVGITFAYRPVQESDPGLAQFHLENANMSHDFCYVFLDNEEARKRVAYFDRWSGHDGKAEGPCVASDA